MSYKTRQDNRFSDINGLTENVKNLRLQYKHKRMQSKNALVNHYKSLSLMNGDDFSKILNQNKNDRYMGGQEKIQQDFDDISSIYTAHGLHNKVEQTMKRVRHRDIILDNFDEKEDIMKLNKEIDNLQITEEKDENEDSHRISGDNGNSNPIVDDILDNYIKGDTKIIKNDLDKAHSEIDFGSINDDDHEAREKQILEKIEQYDYKEYKPIKKGAAIFDEETSPTKT